MENNLTSEENRKLYNHYINELETMITLPMILE